MNDSFFEPLARVFQDSANECAVLMGASAYATETEPLLDKKGETVGVAAYLIRFRFENFFMEFAYAPKITPRIGAPSTLLARVYPDTRERMLPFSAYDLMNVISPDDFICRQFSYIESKERMKDCVLFLAKSFQRHIARIEALAKNPAALEAAYRDLRQEINDIYRQDIFAESGNGDTYDFELLQMRLYGIEKWKSALFASNEYGEFLSGNPAPIIALPGRSRILPRYLARLAAALSRAERPYRALPDEAASLPAMLNALEHGVTWPVLLLTLLLTFPLFAALFLGLYLAVAAIVRGDAVFSTALTVSGALSVLFPVLLVTAAFSSLLSRPILRLFFKKRYAAIRPYDRMIHENVRRRPGEILRRVVLLFSVVLTVLSACRGIFFYNDGFTVRDGFFPFSPIGFSYEDVDYLLVSGSEGHETYRIVMKDGGVLDLSSVMSYGQSGTVKALLDPLFEDYGITPRRNPPITRNAASDSAKTALSEGR